MTSKDPYLLSELFALSRRFLDKHTETYKRDILQSFKKARLGIIIGQRGVGKTTFLLQRLLDVAENNPLSPDILYIPCDHFLIGNHSLYEITETFYQMGGKWIAFDEIHHYPHWSKELKSLFDSYPDLNMMASGSSALDIRRGTHDLSRRAIALQMPGYSFREYLELTHQLTLPVISLAELVEHHTKMNQSILKSMGSLKILSEFKRYLQIGYYPYHRQFDDKTLFYMTLEQNLQYTLESDLQSIYPSLTGHSIRKIKQLMSFLASAVPFTPNFTKLRALLEIGDERTLKTYLNYLHESALVRLCTRFSSKMKQLEKPEKIYLNNPNQMLALCLGEPNLGTLRELFFLSMLSFKHKITIPSRGDFMIDGRWLVEIGGGKKDFSQIQNQNNAFLACDDIEQGFLNKIPLWLFGFLY